MAVRHQVSYDRTRAAGIVDVHAVEGGAAERAVQQNDRLIIGKICHQRLRIDVGRHDDHAVDPAAHSAHCSLELASVAVRAGENEVVAASAGGQVDSADDL